MQGMKKIKIDKLNIDHGYQRPVKRPVVRRIVKGYDPKSFSPLVVGRRPDGRYFVIDGQQRLTAAKELELETVQCAVMETKGIEEEAAIFRKINGGRMNINFAEIFNADLTSGDDKALRIKGIVEANGFIISRYPTTKKNAIVMGRPLVTLYDYRPNGVVLDRVLKVIADSWPAESKEARKAWVLSGLGWFFAQSWDEIDTKRLISKLKQITPSALKAKADDVAALMSGSRHIAIAKAVADVYNRGLAASKKVTLL